MNDYDPCVANKIVNGTQMTVTWYVDNLKVSHKDHSIIDGFVVWLRSKYEKRQGTDPHIPQELNTCLPGY